MEKIYISDLDGTLLNKNAELSEFTKKELDRLIKEENVNFTVATARNVNTILRIFENIELKLPVIEFNGAFITETATKKKLVVNNIREDIIDGFLNMCKEYAQFPLVSAFDGEKSNLYYKDNISAGMDLYLNDSRKINSDYLLSANDDESYKNEKIICFTLINKKEKLDSLIDEIYKEYGNCLSIYYNQDIYYKDWHWASIYSNEATKGRAVKRLIELMNVKDSMVTVFGDHDNDMEMFNAADKSIAVANAQDNLKEHADAVIGSNLEDSVVKFIREDIKIN